MMTPWGYTVEELPPLLTVAEFIAITGSAFDAADTRIESQVAAVSNSVRMWCGWHISPALTCTARLGGQGRLLLLPSMAVQSVESVTENGTALTDGSDFEWKSNGLLRRMGFRCWPHGWNSVEVSFTSGFDSGAVPELMQIVAQIVSNSLAGAPGVRREQAGQVSVEYNQTANGVSGGVALLPRDLLMLQPYKLTGEVGW